MTVAISGDNDGGNGSSTDISGRDEFVRTAAKLAVAQICESVGFHGFQNSAGETLAEIAIRYLRDLAKTAHYYSNLAGRTESNVFDAILALEDVSPSGMVIDPSRPLANSTAFREVMKYVEFGEEVPFARALPRIPIPKKRNPPPSFLQLREEPPSSHIPRWAPAFPDPHTYKVTPVWAERKVDPAKERLEQARQRRRAENCLFSLLRLSSGASALPPSAGPSFGALSASREQEELLARLEVEGKAKGKRPVTLQNSYLAPPLPAGVKEVTPICFDKDKKKPAEEHPNGSAAFSSVLEAFAPVVQAAKSGVHEISNHSNDLHKRNLPDPKERPPILLSFGFGAKAPPKGKAASLILGKRMDGVRGLQLDNEEEMDEKKRRAEQILAAALDGMEDGA